MILGEVIEAEMKNKMRKRSVVIVLSVSVFYQILTFISNQYFEITYSAENITWSIMNVLLIYILIKTVVIYPKTKCEFELDNKKNKKELFILLSALVFVFIVFTCYFISVKQEIEVRSIVLACLFVLLVLIYALVIMFEKDGIYGNSLFVLGSRVSFDNIIKYEVEDREILLQYERKIAFIKFKDIMRIPCKPGENIEFINIMNKNVKI